MARGQGSPKGTRPLLTNILELLLDGLVSSDFTNTPDDVNPDYQADCRSCDTYWRRWWGGDCGKRILVVEFKALGREEIVCVQGAAEVVWVQLKG